MSKAWLKVIFGASYEMIWVIDMKRNTTWWEILRTVIVILISLYALIKAGEGLSVGTAYAVFIGLGSAGTIVTDHFLFHTPSDIGKVLLLLPLLMGVIGLKMVTGNKEEEARQVSYT